MEHGFSATNYTVMDALTKGFDLTEDEAKWSYFAARLNVDETEVQLTNRLQAYFEKWRGLNGTSSDNQGAARSNIENPISHELSCRLCSILEAGQGQDTDGHGGGSRSLV